MKASILVTVLFLSGCNPNQHVWDALNACKGHFDEECTLVAIPVSRGDELEIIYHGWAAE